MLAHQRLFGDDRSEPVQVQALKDHQSNHGSLFVLICRVRGSLWVHQADGGAGTGIPLKARHWSVIQPGNRDQHAHMKSTTSRYGSVFILLCLTTT